MPGIIRVSTKIGGFSSGVFALPAYAAAVPAGFSAEAQALFAVMTSSPNNARKTLIDNVIVALKSASIWTKLDALHVLAAGNAHDALLNWKNPGTYDCTAVNTPTFTADAGYLGGSSSYLDTHFPPSTAPAPQFAQNNSTVFAYGNTTGALQASLIGTLGIGSGNAYSIYPRYTDNNSYYRNGETGGVVVSNTEGKGLYAADRPDSSTVNAYKNGSLAGTASTSAIPLENRDLIYLEEPEAGSVSYAGIILAGGLGASLDAAAHAALYSALHTYMQAVAGVA